MKSIYRAGISGTLIFLALCLTAGSGLAQEQGGSFTLPFRTHWGNAVLPPGNYTFTLLFTQDPYLVDIRGKSASAFILAVGSTIGTTADDTRLDVVRIGGEHFVRRLELKERGITLRFRAPKMQTSASGRPQGIPVTEGRGASRGKKKG